MRISINEKQYRQLQQWETRGKPFPPPAAYKQLVIRFYAAEYKLKVLVETGTCLGEMIQANLNFFDQLYSIELSQELFTRASQIFNETKNVFLFQGESHLVLSQIMPRINEPCIFWLDAHYSAGITAKGEKETPIMEELSELAHFPHINKSVILIDDARCFNGQGAWPALEAIKHHAQKALPHSHFECDTDIIRVYFGDFNKICSNFQ